MNNEQILKKVIEKAVKNGYNYEWLKHDQAYRRYYELIFSHSFAKAFWFCEHELEDYLGGSYREKCKKCKATTCLGTRFSDWRNYLQQMVLEEEPLKYLEKFL